MQPQPITLKSATIAVALIASGVIGTATYYDVVDAPVAPQDQIRYEKVDDDTYIKKDISVREETVKISEQEAFINMLDQKIAEFEGSTKPEDIKRHDYAVKLKAERVAELEQIKNIGLSTDTVLQAVGVTTP